MHIKKLHKHGCFNVKTKTKTLKACGEVYVIFCSLIIQAFAKYVYKQSPVCDNSIKLVWSDILKRITDAFFLRNCNIFLFKKKLTSRYGGWIKSKLYLF